MERKYSYFNKYNVLKNEFISIKDLQVLMESSYEKSRQKMIDLIDYIEQYNKKNPDMKYRISYNPYKIPKKIVIKELNLDESYIFKKAKEELQLIQLGGY